MILILSPPLREEGHEVAEGVSEGTNVILREREDVLNLRRSFASREMIFDTTKSKLDKADNA